MKTLLMATMMLMGLVGSAFAQDFQARQGGRLALPISEDREVIQEAVPTQEAIDGVVGMAIRTGQPLQMINPRAPKEFGNGEKMVSRNPANPRGPAEGIIILGFRF